MKSTYLLILFITFGIEYVNSISQIWNNELVVLILSKLGLALAQELSFCFELDSIFEK